VDVEAAIRGRRTHKSFAAEPVPPRELEELFELARFAPNHHLTQPWRFRVLGPESLARLKEAAGPVEAPKLDRAPTLVVAAALLTGAQQQDEEDVCATAAAVYAVLLGAHARGLASYWRTPAVLRTREGREALGIPHGERVLGLIHLGRPVTQPAGKERAAVGSFLSFLD
jgi:nitroreductase